MADTRAPSDPQSLKGDEMMRGTAEKGLTRRAVCNGWTLSFSANLQGVLGYLWRMADARTA